MNEIAHSVRILITGDHPDFREGLRLLQAEREFLVAAAAPEMSDTASHGRFHVAFALPGASK